MMQYRKLLWGPVLALSVVGISHASPVAPGFDATQIAACDDCFTNSISLGFTANFYGASYSDTFVSNNGYLTFNSGQGTYTPFGLGAGYTGQPIIAPFFADVDTRGAGSGLTSYGSGTYAGHTAFGATWPAVGYFGGHTDKLNTFQVILVDRSDVGAGDFDIYFNYGSIQWETGDASGGHDGLGGTSAAVGFANGTGDPGTYYQLPGSLVPGSFIDGGPDQLITGTNDGTPGQYLFAIRNGHVIPTPEPASLGLLGLGVVGVLVVRRRRTAVNT